MKPKNFFYRINPESVLSELTSIQHDEWLQFFLNFFHDLRNDEPLKARTELASKIIQESHNFRELRSKAGKASVKQKVNKSQHMFNICSTEVEPVAVAVTEAVIKKNKDRAFCPPTPEEVKSYCIERGNNVDYAKWHNFYQAKNWMIGKTQMRDWQAAVRTWEDSKTIQAPTRRAH